MSSAILSLLSSLESAPPSPSPSLRHPDPYQARAEKAVAKRQPSRDGSLATERLRAQVRAVGPHFRAALVTGERGARKEEVARALHCASPVAKGPFVICDAGWMETLLRDCNSGVSSAEQKATFRHLARTANGGTIFFPELGLFSKAAQRELLHFLECLGAEQGNRVRVVASVSGDVQVLVSGGGVLAELRERIGVVELAVAPLRERLTDFEGVADRVFAEMAVQTGDEAVTISEEALQELRRRGWPGNDRELESTLRLAAMMCRGGRVEVEHLPAAAEEATMQSTEKATLSVTSMKLQEVVDAHVQEVVRRCDGNKLKAAEVLGISRSTLYRMLDAMVATV